MAGAPRVSFDIGGTFADIVAVMPNGSIRVAKLLSVPDSVATDVRTWLTSLLAGEPDQSLDSLVHGTTICSNALLEGKGAPTGLITTEGFRDDLEMRRLARPGVFDFLWRRTPPLVSRRLRREVAERMSADGTVFRPLDVDGAREAVRFLGEAGVEAVAVSFINAYVNPEHERIVADLVREMLPDVALSVSHDVLPEMREYERASTTAVNAYLMPVVERYVGGLERELGDLCHDGLRIAQSNGGLTTAEHARRYPVNLVESGPAAGVLACAVMCREIGLDRAVSFDMGGTTVKACLIEGGQPIEKNEMEVGGQANATTRYSRGAGYAVSVPALDIVEAGAGGGSIARVDESGVLRVGPTSAGAEPGPICYGRGGREATITDANVVLGYMNPEAIAGGTVPIDRAAALAGFEKVLGRRLGLTAQAAAHGVHTVANAAMMRAIRAVTTERGRDPRDFALIAFGGAGPMHAAGLAERLGMRRVYVPLYPGLFSALGLLLADIRFDHVQSVPGRLDTMDPRALSEEFERIAARMRADIREQELDPDMVRIERYLDLRYQRQTSELTIPLPDGKAGEELVAAVTEQFHSAHERNYGYRSENEPVVVVSLRLKALAPSQSIRFRDIAASFARDGAPSAESVRRCYFGPDLGERDTSIVARAGLVGGPREGPLVVEEADTTVVVPPGWRARLDEFASIVLEKMGAAEQEGGSR